MSDLSPMMKQYFNIKKKYDQGILFFRLGDFYEMFYEDAKIANKELNLTLTSRSCGGGQRAPMCGVPYSNSEIYISRLISKGYKVVICEQKSSDLELFDREVTRIVTPGTVVEDSMLNESKSNFLAVCACFDETVSLCFCDVSTGNVMITDFFGENCLENIENEIKLLLPSEVVLIGEFTKKFKFFLKKICVFEERMLSCDFESTKSEVFSVFKIFDPEIKKNSLMIETLGALIKYLKEINKESINRLEKISIYKQKDYLVFECESVRNLEIFETIQSRELKGSLIWVLDKTKTPMGKRLLRSWLEKPLRNVNDIVKRQNAVEEICSNFVLLDNINYNFCDICDVERLVGRVAMGSANCRDLKNIMVAIEKIPKIKEVISNCKSDFLCEIYKNMDELKDIYDIIDNSISDDPPVNLKEGGIIKRGYNFEIDEIYDQINGSENVISKIENNERRKTGLSKLKVGFNRIFGYYIEISDSFKKFVPENYVRKQTLSGRERYITDELKLIETKILNARERVVKIEYEIFENVRTQIFSQISRINVTARMLAFLDVIKSFAEVSISYKYVKPVILETNEIKIKNGRHPVVEQLLVDGEEFVANDCRFDDSEIAMVITGPNMVGKSTYMRQIALIVVMAQIGCFVPAAAAELGVVSNIFSRIGASDNVSDGKSTFMLEMHETSWIVKNATEKSLVILDEIGRGTSTFDGLSIAQAVLEFIVGKIKSKTLFSTHYHELGMIEKKLAGVKNYTFGVKQVDDGIIFLRKISPGSSDNSFGIEVAKLAGVPDSVIFRARELLRSFS
ncbi:MAG: DNA mismatch repair protein MutS [Candidatus Improbicoccus devescovinae]|nr:MAG: DNA mismatch repair protein MutS [Candidatus Improbicoccus devescovinae]